MRKILFVLFCVVLACMLILPACSNDKPAESTETTTEIITEPTTIETETIVETEIETEAPTEVETEATMETEPYVEPTVQVYNPEPQSFGDEFWDTKYNEYPTATTIYKYFKDVGYNDAVCAGILGNIMCEVGGQTFSIAYWLDLNGYFGMCMWYKNYSPNVVGRDLLGQCDYLAGDIERQFNDFGWLSGYTYADFCNINDPGTAAVVFAEVYERCGSGSYGIRQTNAYTAYDYFTTE